MTLWGRHEAAQAVQGTALGDWSGFHRIVFDSRSVQIGDLFVALKDQRDGHDFVADALKNGAAAACVSRMPDGLDETAPLLMVESVLPALEALGQAARQRNPLLFRVAVTGSAGKTTTKEMLRCACQASGKTHAADQSYNNHWGVPLTLAQTPRSAQFGIYELGMNHAGEISALTQMVQPDIAVITTIAPAHLAAFDSVEQIAQAKAEIFEGLANGGSAVLPKDSPWYDMLAAQALANGAGRVISFGRNESADFRLLAAEIIAEVTKIDALIFGAKVHFEIGAAGEHQALNALATLAVSLLAGADVSKAMQALGQWSAPQGRGQRQSISLPLVGDHAQILLIDESYNANPASMRVALQSLAMTARLSTRQGKGRRLAVLGDMLELGAQSEALHAKIGAEIAHDSTYAGIDLVFACGLEAKALYEALPAARRGAWAIDSVALEAILQDAVQDGDVLMIKGSAGSKMRQAVTGLITQRSLRNIAV